jgi:hypothetical protein
VGLILDLAIVVLGLVVIGSLATLAWTLAVSAVRAEQHGLARVVDARRRAAIAEERVRTAAARLAGAIDGLEYRSEERHQGEHTDA